MTWPSRELDALFGTPTGAGVTRAALQRLIDDQVPESEVIDFQGRPVHDPPKSRTWSGEAEFAKDVASFANHRGGVIVYGVTEKPSGVAGELTPINPKIGIDGEERWCGQALRNCLAPPVDVEYLPVDAGSDGWFLLIVVPRSRRGPHAVLDPDDSSAPLRYPVRHGGQTRWLDEHEVAARYRRRESGSRNPPQ